MSITHITTETVRAGLDFQLRDCFWVLHMKNNAIECSPNRWKGVKANPNPKLLNFMNLEEASASSRAHHVPFVCRDSSCLLFRRFSRCWGVRNRESSRFNGDGGTTRKPIIHGDPRPSFPQRGFEWFWYSMMNFYNQMRGSERWGGARKAEKR